MILLSRLARCRHLFGTKVRSSGRQHRRPSRSVTHRLAPETLEGRTLPALLLTVNSLADGPVNLADSTFTLRDALFMAKSGDVIDFEPNLFSSGPGTIKLNQGQLGIRTDLAIM